MESNVGEPRYTAHCSTIRGVITTIIAGIFLLIEIIFFVSTKTFAGVFLIITAILALIGFLRILRAKFHKIIFYENKVVERKGIINTKEKSSVLAGIIGVSVEQKLFGKIFNYGDIVIDKVGRGWDISTKCIAKPYELKTYLEQLIDNMEVNNKINTMIMN